ncbi:hypothetical protein BJY01DRAFT_248494 [Aspergillus pseudoustus]|uniref:Major facilitator superfamily domain-containing protein n=1 Tax=Aspergillus pseudoustus TaxID=1810923 RepID=A0ABR4JXR4_9EURO
MSGPIQDIDAAWPPGTIRLEDLAGSAVIREPKPSEDRNDPLTKRDWQKLALWTNSQIPLGQLAKHACQPFVVMFSIPAVFYLAIEYGIMTACTTVPVTTLSSVTALPPYNFGSAQAGLMGIPPFLGTCVAAITFGPLSDKLVIFLARQNAGIYEPEMRLWLCLLASPFVPAGLFMSGVGLDRGTRWLLPAFGLGLTAFGVAPAGSAALTYLTDAYTNATDSIVAVTFTRNVISTMFVFALQPWVDQVGLTWFYVTFGLIAMLVQMGNIVFMRFGKSLRESGRESVIRRLFMGNRMHDGPFPVLQIFQYNSQNRDRGTSDGMGPNAAPRASLRNSMIMFLWQTALVAIYLHLVMTPAHPLEVTCQ